MFEIRVSSRNEGRLRRNVCRGGVCGYNTLGLESPSCKWYRDSEPNAD